MRSKLKIQLPYAMMGGRHFQQSGHLPAMIANPARAQLDKNFFFPCSCSRLRVWSRELVSVLKVPWKEVYGRLAAGL